MLLTTLPVLSVEDVAFAAKCVGEDELLADRDDVQRRSHRIRLPDQRAVFGIQAPDEAIVRAFVGAIETADVEPSVAGAERALGGDVVVGRQPDRPRRSPDRGKRSGRCSSAGSPRRLRWLAA